MAFFCTKTGVRIAGIGVSKSVDPKDGHEEVVEHEGVEMSLVEFEKLMAAKAKADAHGKSEQSKPNK